MVKLSPEGQEFMKQVQHEHVLDDHAVVPLSATAHREVSKLLEFDNGIQWIRRNIPALRSLSQRGIENIADDHLFDHAVKVLQPTIAVVNLAEKDKQVSPSSVDCGLVKFLHEAATESQRFLPVEKRKPIPELPAGLRAVTPKIDETELDA